MVEVCYHREYFRVVVDGHAGAGEYGYDLVCAAVSALCLTLAENMKRLQAQGVVRDVVADMKDGHAELSCVPVRKYKNVIEVVFGTVMTGFDAIRALDHDMVKITEYA